MVEDAAPGRVSVLQALLDMPSTQQKALGIEATAGEIAQQPRSWLGTRNIFEDLREQVCAFLEKAGVAAEQRDRPVVILAGAGTSDYIGQSLALLLRTQWGCETFSVASPDLMTHVAELIIPCRRYLCISFSRSGSSPEGIIALTQMLQRYPEIRHLVVTCNASGVMLDIVRGHAHAFGIVLDDAVNDRGLAMTSSYSNMVILGQLLAHAWSPRSYDPVFAAIVSAGEAFLTPAASCAQQLAAIGYKRVCMLGSGVLMGVARESSLKVMEMTAGRVKTMSESVLGLRHGPMAALDRETLLVCFASGDARRQNYEADLLREVDSKKIVANCIVIAPAAATQFAACNHHLLPVQDGVPDLYRPPVDVIFGQLLGLFFSLAHGLKPDAPSPQGIITRVVPAFKSYE